MQTATRRQAKAFCQALLALRSQGRFAFALGALQIAVTPDPEPRWLKLQFTAGDLETLALDLDIRDGNERRQSRLYVTEGPWQGRSGAAAYYPDGQSQFLLVHGHHRQMLHEMNQLHCLYTQSSIVGSRRLLVSKVPFPGVQGGPEISRRVTKWLTDRGGTVADDGRLLLGTDADLRQVLVNTLILALLKQHVRGSFVLSSLVNELPPLRGTGSSTDGDDEVDGQVQQALAAYAAEEGATEGRLVRRFVNQYERRPELRAAAIRIHGTACKACGFDFGLHHGPHGQGFIEVHHLVPLSEVQGERFVNPVDDLTVLCANCHRMAHLNPDRVLTVAELQALLCTAGVGGKTHAL